MYGGDAHVYGGDAHVYGGDTSVCLKFNVHLFICTYNISNSTQEHGMHAGVCKYVSLHDHNACVFKIQYAHM